MLTLRYIKNSISAPVSLLCGFPGRERRKIIVCWLNTNYWRVNPRLALCQNRLRLPRQAEETSKRSTHVSLDQKSTFEFRNLRLLLKPTFAKNVVFATTSTTLRCRNVRAKPIHKDLDILGFYPRQERTDLTLVVLSPSGSKNGHYIGMFSLRILALGLLRFGIRRILSYQSLVQQNKK